MALQQSITLEYGIDLPNAYARISGIHHTHNELVAHVEWWADATSRLADKAPVKRHSFSLPWQETVSLAQVYGLLKLQDAFAGSIDV